MSEKDGQRELPPVVVAIVTSEHGVLLGRRQDGVPPWTFLGGQAEPGEAFAATAVREVAEESGLRVEAAEQEIGRRVHPATERAMIYLACRPVDLTEPVADGDELARVRWVSIAEAEQLLPDLYEPVRLYLVRELGKS